MNMATTQGRPGDDTVSLAELMQQYSKRPACPGPEAQGIVSDADLLEMLGRSDSYVCATMQPLPQFLWQPGPLYESTLQDMKPGGIRFVPEDTAQTERARIRAWLESMKPSETPFTKGSWEIERQAQMALWTRMRDAIDSGREAPKGEKL